MSIRVKANAILAVAFWAGYILFDVMKRDKSCNPATNNMYCPKNIKLAEGEILFYHTIAISALAFCFMVSLHVIFTILDHSELSILMLMTTSIIIGLFGFSHLDVENAGFHCLGFLIGVYGANLVVLTHLLSIYWKNRKLRARQSESDEEPEEVAEGDDSLPEVIEMRNDQPGCYFDINTRTHIYNFERS
ncbi:hypothetical protein HHI36_023651 [Cryptolaemus montrouzieri]|uniref:Uncharacterized protein n=1 Tax=Cryptolaemus montrouzieri TaxID=559131 RepID=A0ABD2PHS0_9CUCU